MSKIAARAQSSVTLCRADLCCKQPALSKSCAGLDSGAQAPKLQNLPNKHVVLISVFGAGTELEEAEYQESSRIARNELISKAQTMYDGRTPPQKSETLKSHQANSDDQAELNGPPCCSAARRRSANVEGECGAAWSKSEAEQREWRTLRHSSRSPTSRNTHNCQALLRLQPHILRANDLLLGGLLGLSRPHSLT